MVEMMRGSWHDEQLDSVLRLGRRMAIIRLFDILLMILIGFICWHLGAGAVQAGQAETSPGFEELAKALIDFWRWINGT